MKRERRKDLVIGASISITLSSTYTAFSVYLVTLLIRGPLEREIVPIVLVVLSMPVFYWGTYLFAVRDARQALEHGVVLTDDTLSISGKKITLDHILRVEIADFQSGSPFLAIGYAHDTEKRKTRAILLWPKTTEDIWELCNRIRNMKGWAHQEEVKLHGHWAWSQWKDQLKRMA